MKPMLQLIPMSEEEFEAYLALDIAMYAEENVKAGYWQPAEALEKFRQAHEKLLPKGLRTEGQQLYRIEEVESGLKVGILWLAESRETTKPSGFVYDLFIDEHFRRRGYATEAMQLLEDRARELKLQEIGLHVFAHNPAAIALYEKLGYKVKSLNMTKEIHYDSMA